MRQMVDSNEKMLELNELLEIAVENMGIYENVQPNLRVAAAFSEMDQPEVIVLRFGNTLFEVIPNEKGNAYFKSFNADTARNFLENSIQLVRWAKEEGGLKYLITQFKDKTLLTLFRAISMNPPYPNMGYQANDMKNGQIRVVVNLGS